MERNDVYKMIDGERNHQDTRWHGEIPDSEKSVAEWLTYIEIHLNKAKTSVYNLDKIEALNELRKIAALSVCALEVHGCPPREYKTYK